MKKIADIIESSYKADPALSITFKFVILGIAWILFSDSLLFIAGSQNVLWKIAHIHILKGLLFVGVTGGFLFYWTNRFVHSLRQREDEVQSIFHSSPIAMGIVDSASFQFLEVNEALIALFDFSAHEMRNFTMTDIAEDKERFEAVPLLIKTGSRDVGIWKQIKKNGSVVSVKLCAQPIRDKKGYLILFIDYTREASNEMESRLIRINAERRMSDDLSSLTRTNEELAYRASQTEHVNAELIAVNEQLQHVNKKIALRAEEFSWKNERINEITGRFAEVFWSFDLTEKSRSYISASAELLYEECLEKLNKPWFWLDYIHPEEDFLKGECHQQLMDSGRSSCAYRIITGKGNVKTVLSRIKLVHDEKGIPLIVGSVTDISLADPDIQKFFFLKSRLSKL